MKIYEKAIENYIAFSREHYKKLSRFARRDYKRNIKRMMSKGGCILEDCDKCPIHLARQYYPIDKCCNLKAKGTRRVLNLEAPDNVDVQSKKQQEEDKTMTKIEKTLIQNFKFENAKIFDIQILSGSVSFCVKGRCSELDERLTKENPTDDFIKELKKMEEKNGKTTNEL